MLRTLLLALLCAFICGVFCVPISSPAAGASVLQLNLADLDESYGPGREPHIVQKKWSRFEPSIRFFKRSEPIVLEGWGI
ncbi:hypothetical protein AAVH_01979 [Aphelenchoides avenae]|nr:hypothetical protein AAVH_01979 [Aphelenchus avenae]